MEINNEKKYFRIDNRLFVSVFWNCCTSNITNCNNNNNNYLGGNK